MTTTDRPVLVLGASGKTGRRVVEQLRAAGRPVRAASRSSDLVFDWAEPDSWRPALDGAGSLYLLHPETPEPVEPFLELVRTSDVDRVVLLSARHPEQSGDGLVPLVEDAVSSLPVPTTLLRPSWFTQNFTEGFFTADLLERGVLRLPVGDGREPFIDADDIAAVAVHALTTTEPTSGEHDLSGPELMTFGDAVAALGRAWGRPLRFESPSEEEWRAGLAGSVPQAELDVFSSLFLAIASGENDHLSTGVQDVLGREPVRLENTMARTPDV